MKSQPWLTLKSWTRLLTEIKEMSFFLSAIHDFKVSGLVSAPFPALQPVTAQDGDSGLRATQQTQPDLVVSQRRVISDMCWTAII